MWIGSFFYAFYIYLISISISIISYPYFSVPASLIYLLLKLVQSLCCAAKSVDLSMAYLIASTNIMLLFFFQLYCNQSIFSKMFALLHYFLQSSPILSTSYSLLERAMTSNVSSCAFLLFLHMQLQ